MHGIRWRTLQALAGAVIVALVASVTALGAGQKKPAPVQGVTRNTIKVGTILPFTSTASAGAFSLFAGIQAAIGEINAEGGINGRTLTLEVLDDHFDAATHVEDFNQLLSRDKVYAVLAPAGSANIPGDWPIAKRTGIPIFAPYLPPDPSLPSVFLLATNHVSQAEVLVRYLVQHGAKTLTFIGQQNDLGMPIWQGLQIEAQKLHVTANSPIWIQPGSTDVSTAVIQAHAQNPDAVVFGGDLGQTAVILKQAATLGWHPQFAGVDTNAGANTTTVTAAAGTAAEGLLGTFTSNSAAVNSVYTRKFQAAVTRYATNGDSYTSNSYSLLNYASVQVFAAILRRMGSDLSWANFQKVAQSIKGFKTGVLPLVTFGPLPNGHTGVTGAKVAQFTNGAWVNRTPTWLQP